MAKINWGTTAQVLAGPVASAIHKQRNKPKMNTPPAGSSDASSGGNTDDPATPGSFKYGGKVKKTGKARVHKGERVLTKKQARKYDSKKR